MAETGTRPAQQRVRRRNARATQEQQEGEYDISISALGSSHRAGALVQANQLFPATHLHMAREWPVHCPLFKQGLEVVCMDTLEPSLFINLDMNLITALVERWSPATNTFHLPVGEMTITLQDVQIILGLKIDGEPFIGKRMVGPGLKWETWKDCCLQLLGTWPDPTVTFQDPDNSNNPVTFTMGSSRSNSSVPLRWLRWSFYKESYTELDEPTFMCHIRAYCLFMIGCLLLPDTSGSHVPLIYLTLMEDLDSFRNVSVGGAVLAYLYRELCLATNPERTYISGCLPLLQVWCWERINIGRPSINMPTLQQLANNPLAMRWVTQSARELAVGNLQAYRTAFDELRHNQVVMRPYNEDLVRTLDPICRENSEICTARVPLIGYKRVEWHLADRVMRQFGGIQSININPIDRNFQRVDGRGRGDIDWAQYYNEYISLWLARRQFITPITRPTGNGREELSTYLTWYKSWASLNLSRTSSQSTPAVDPTSTYDRDLVEYYFRSRSIAERFYNLPGESQSTLQQSLNEIYELSSRVDDSLFIDYDVSDTHRAHVQQQTPRRSTYDSSRRSSGRSSHNTIHEPQRHSMYVGSTDQAMPSTFDVGQSSQHWNPFQLQLSDTAIYQQPMNLDESVSQPTTIMEIPNWMSPFGIPSVPSQQDLLFQQSQPDEGPINDEVQQEQRERRAPNRYTPGSGAIPRRRRS